MYGIYQKITLKAMAFTNKDTLVLGCSDLLVILR